MELLSTNSALHIAPFKNHLNVVNVLIEAKARLDQITHDGKTALNLAAVAGHNLIINRLVGAGESVDGDAWPPLCSAAFGGHKHAVRLLLVIGADVYGFKYHGKRTALHYAAENNHLTVVEILLEVGARLSQTDSEGYTAVGLAARAGHVGMINKLATAGADVNGGAWPAIGRAAWNGHTEAVRALLALGADVDGVTREGNWTALYFAVRNGDLILVDILLEAGARLSQTFSNGFTALGTAAYMGNVDVINKLVAAGADVNEGDWPALGAAARNGHLEAVRTLLALGADVHGVSSNDKWTALHVQRKIIIPTL